MFNSVAHYPYLLPTVYLLSQIQTYLCVVVGPGFVSISPAFMKSSASHPDGPHGLHPSPHPSLYVVVYPLPWPLLVGGVRCSRLWSTSQLLRPSGQQCSHSGGVCPQIQGRQCGAYVGAVEEMMCVVCVDVTEGA